VRISPACSPPRTTSRWCFGCLLRRCSARPSTGWAAGMTPSSIATLPSRSPPTLTRPGMGRSTMPSPAWSAPRLARGTRPPAPRGGGRGAPAAAHAQAARPGAVPGYRGFIFTAATAAAQLARARGQPETVVAALAPLLHLERRDSIDEPAVFPWHDLLVDALVAVGEHDQAAAVLGPFEATAATRGRHSAMAAAARGRANLEAARRNQARADPPLPTRPRP